MEFPAPAPQTWGSVQAIGHRGLHVQPALRAVLFSHHTTSSGEHYGAENENQLCPLMMKLETKGLDTPSPHPVWKESKVSHSQQLLLCGSGQAQFLSEDQSHAGPAHLRAARLPLGAGVQPVPGACPDSHADGRLGGGPASQLPCRGPEASGTSGGEWTCENLALTLTHTRAVQGQALL